MSKPVLWELAKYRIRHPNSNGLLGDTKHEAQTLAREIMRLQGEMYELELALREIGMAHTADRIREMLGESPTPEAPNE